MRRRSLAGIVLCSLLATGATAEEEAEVQLLGPLSRQQIEDALPDWVVATVEAVPDLAVAEELTGGATEGVEVIVYLGTWCSDSRRELARLWRALDAFGGEPSFTLSYVGVARGLEEPAELVAGVGLEYVPTLVVRRDGEEVGRIVEESPHGVEVDLLDLVAARRRGVISARTDLDAPPDGSR